MLNGCIGIDNRLNCINKESSNITVRRFWYSTFYAFYHYIAKAIELQYPYYRSILLIYACSLTHKEFEQLQRADDVSIAESTGGGGGERGWASSSKKRADESSWEMGGVGPRAAEKAKDRDREEDREEDRDAEAAAASNSVTEDAVANGGYSSRSSSGSSSSRRGARGAKLSPSEEAISMLEVVS